MNHSSRIAIALLFVSGLGSLNASAVPTVVNGSFEADRFIFNGSLDLGGASPLTGWRTFHNGTYPWGLPNGNQYNAGPTPHGNQWVIVGNFGQGGTWIEQTVGGFTAGQTYTLRFALASEFVAAQGALVEVSFPSGSSTASQVFQAPFRGANFWDTWRTFSMNFVAVGTSVTIRFAGLAGPGFDAGIDNVSIVACVRITKPADGDDFDLTLSGNTATQIEFSADSATPIPQVSWTLSLEYQTSGGRGPFTNSRTFSTPPAQPRTERYTGMGGRLKVKAGALDCPDDEIQVTITGVQIPDNDITARLVNLYAGGATPRLMTGIAQLESSYKQFSPRTLYGRPDLWPTESFDGGSHVGLMQMPVSMQMGWDWSANTQGGVALFRQKLAVAQRLEGRIRNNHTMLRELTAVERENMALVLYGPHASASLGAQYYVPQCIGGVVNGADCIGGTWEWVENIAGNLSGVNYAKRARSLMR